MRGNTVTDSVFNDQFDIQPMSSIEFGTFLPRWSSQARTEAFQRIATTADEHGYDWIGRGDHVVIPAGAEGWDADTNAYDVFGVLANVAAVTDDVRIGTKICVVPYRHPVLLAKQVLTLDNLSDGRFELGVAPGWFEAEFDVLDVPFEERGPRTDEFLALFEQVCENGEIAFEGPHHAFETTGFYPRPVGDVPVWVGGHSSPAFRRVAEYGDGWAYTADPDGIREARERILHAWDDFDREGAPDVAAGQSAYVGEDPPAEVAGPLVGTPEEVIEGVEAYVEAGATRLDLKFGSTTESLDDHLTQIERFAEDVMPAFQ